MADIGRKQTDKLLQEMERHIADIYRHASEELTAKADKYFARFAEMDAERKAMVEAGEMTEEAYKEWRYNKIMTGKHWTATKDQAAQELLRANETATAYLNDQLPRVYAVNYNAVAGELGRQVSGGYSFELVDAHTVKNLATSNDTLLPYKYVDGKKDVRWNTQRVNAEVLQGVLQGESMDKIARRLETVGMKAAGSAIRNARTTVTSAENKGRMDMLHDAADKGVVCHKIWSAIHDSHTREAHEELDGEEAEIDEPFENELGEIMYPGDIDADPANVYNCRCTLKYKVVSIRGKEVSKEIGKENAKQENNPYVEGTALNGDRYATMPETLGGATRGEPMSFEEANKRAANPGYRAGTGTAQNCQSCVVAHEARMRGYDVEALSYKGNNTAKTLAESTRIAWVDPKTGDVPDFVPWDYKKAYDKRSFSEFLQSNVKKDERYTLEFGWRNANGGHIINVDRDANGALRFYDAQIGKTYTQDWAIDDLLGRMSYTDKYGREDPPHLLRVDNLAFREDVVNNILTEERVGWKRVIKSEADDDWIPF